MEDGRVGCVMGGPEGMKVLVVAFCSMRARDLHSEVLCGCKWRMQWLGPNLRSTRSCRDLHLAEVSSCLPMLERM